MSDPFAAFLLVIFEGFIQGWYTLRLALGIAAKIRRRPVPWNTALGILLVLTVGLSAVIYAVMKQAPQLSGPFASLPAALIGSTFSGGVARMARDIYRATRAAREGEP